MDNLTARTIKKSQAEVFILKLCWKLLCPNVFDALIVPSNTLSANMQYYLGYLIFYKSSFRAGPL